MHSLFKDGLEDIYVLQGLIRETTAKLPSHQQMTVRVLLLGKHIVQTGSLLNKMNDTRTQFENSSSTQQNALAKALADLEAATQKGNGSVYVPRERISAAQQASAALQKASQEVEQALKETCAGISSAPTLP